MAQTILLAWFMFSTSIAFSSSKTLCQRIFFQNINEETMPYKIIEGVFTKENKDHNNFPVYKRENDNLLFYYTVSKGQKYFVFGLNLQDYFGVAASINSAVDPESWLRSGSLDKNDVFSGLIRTWQYYNTREKRNYYVSASSSSPIIKAVCVDDDFRECNSDRLYLNVNFTDGRGNVVNDPTQDYFYRRQGDFRNLRPIYQHNTQRWYLQYVEGYWVVTGSYTPRNSNDNVFMRNKDFALRPEYISKTWAVHYNGWRDMPELRVLCRGVTSTSNTCASNPCDSKATCIYTSGNETLCLCPPGYTGVTCSINKQCPTPYPISGTEVNFAYPGKRPGDLGLSFCSSPYPSVRFALCMDSSYSSYWSRQGRACRRGQTIITAPPRSTAWYPRTFATQSPWDPVTPRAEPINFDDNPYIVPVVMTGATVLQFSLAFIIFCCARCKKKIKENKEEQDDERRQQEVGSELERRLEQVAQAGSQEELDRGVQDYQQTVQEYERENEEKELSRKQGLYRNASLWRLISMHLYFSFYLWLSYLVGCEISHCTQYGHIFNGLVIYAKVMLGISSVIVFIESIFSHELAYLENIMQDETAWGYIQKMHQVPPKINMVVVCYHYETRTRVVYYTDSNGNSQSRTETYTERVVTFVDQDEFLFGSWVDVSKREMPELSAASVTRVRINPCILFGDQETVDDYQSQVASMLERNKDRDLYTDFSASREIPGLKERISAYVDLRVKPWWIRPLYFWIATLLQMTWPYRWLFRAKTAKSHYILKKKMYKSTVPPREVDIMDPIAVLTSNASSLVTSNAPDNNQPASPMREMANPGIGNPAFQNTCLPYPPVNPTFNPATGLQPAGPQLAGPQPTGPQPAGLQPAEPQPSASPPLYEAAGTPYPPLNAAGPAYPTHPTGSAFPSYPGGSALPSGPTFPPAYTPGPQPSAPPPTYEASVGYNPQPSNEK